jgi:hypothetical protein
MGTAVLAEKPGVLRGEEVWSVKEVPMKKESILERVARSLRLEGYDAEFVREKYDETDVLKHLESWREETGWESKDEKDNKPTVN